MDLNQLAFSVDLSSCHLHAVFPFFLSSSRRAILTLLSSLHCCPFFTSNINNGCTVRHRSAQKVRHHPIPIRSIIKLKTPVPRAPKRHRTRLLPAVAVEGLR